MAWPASGAGLVAAWGNTNSGRTRLPQGVNRVRSVAAGWGHSLALKTDGTVVAWGANDSEQATVPPGLSNVVAVAAGQAHSLALKADGTVVAWGNNSEGQLSVPSGLGAVRAISAGGPLGTHGLALKLDGTVVAWGNYLHGPAWTPADLSSVTAISSSQGYDLALRIDGTVAAWGEGDGCLDMTNVPPGLSGVIAVAAGVSHAYALRADGSVVTWGRNCNGDTNSPPALTDIEAVAEGLALKSDGTIVTWGDNSFGQTNIPVGLAYVMGIAAGGTHDLAIVPEGPVQILRGPGSQGQPLYSNATFTVEATGQGALAYQWFRNGVSLSDNDRVVGAQTATLTATSLKLSDAGNYTVEVRNAFGSVLSTQAVLTVISPPRLLRQPTGQLAPLGGEISLSVGAEGTPPLHYQWRLNGLDIAGATNSTLTLSQISYDQMGYYCVQVSNAFGDVVSAKVWINVVQTFVGSSTPSIIIPTNVPIGLTNVVAVAAGSYHMLALKSDGKVAVWVSSSNYRVLTNVPPTVTNVSAIAAADNYNLVLRSNGTVVAWGIGSGVVGVPSTLTNVVGIAAGETHALALRKDGTVAAWGSDDNHQIEVPAGLANVVAVAAGADHSVALKGNGSVVAWGLNLSGQTNVPASLTNAIAISAQGNHTLALRSDGTVVSWGAPPGNIPRNLTNVVAIAAGPSQDVALLADGRIVVFPWSASQTGTNPVWATLSNAIAIASSAGPKPGFFAAALGNGTPAITIPPATQTAVPGATIQFNARAAGIEPKTFRWQFNGVDIPGATNTSLVLPWTHAGNAGSYRVVVSNPLGTTLSLPAQLVVRQLIVWSLTPGRTSTNTPSTLKQVVAISAADSHMLALQSDGTVVSWGDSFGYLPTNVPPGLNNVVAISAGATHDLALKATGTVAAWGNTYAVTNIPSGLSNVVAVAAGDAFSLALKANGTVACWGTGSAILSVPFGLSNIVAVSAGRDHCLALKANGTVVAWGQNASGQTNTPTGLSQVVAISAGTYHSLAVRSDGTVVSWGAAPPKLPSGLSNIVAVSAGYYLDLALRSDGSLVAWGPTTNNVPSGLSNLTAITTDHTGGRAAALIRDGSPHITVQPGNQIIALGDTVYLHARAVGVQPLSYQWWLNGTPLPQATNASLILSNAHSADLGNYQVVVTNPLGACPSRTAIVRALVSLPFALNAPSLPWTSPSTPMPWFGQARFTHDGSGAAQSGSISDGKQSILQTAVVGPGIISFWWKVSSEEGYDYLRFFLGATNTVKASISGEVDWQRLSFAVPAGTRLLGWVYAKDATVRSGEDAGWIDEVTYVPDPPTIESQPQSFTASAGDIARFTVRASGTPPITYQWLRSGTNLPGATDSVLVFANAARNDSGDYSVLVTNPGGSLLSSNATLTVLVPLRLGVPSLRPDGTLTFASGYADGTAIEPGDFAGFEVQVSVNLSDWAPLTNALTLRDGVLQLLDPEAGNLERRFYRILQR